MDQQPGLGMADAGQLREGVLDEGDMAAQQGAQDQRGRQPRIEAQLLDEMLGIVGETRLVDQVERGTLAGPLGDLDSHLRRQGVTTDQPLQRLVRNMGDQPFGDVERQAGPGDEGVHHLGALAEIGEGALVGGIIETGPVIGGGQADGPARRGNRAVRAR